MDVGVHRAPRCEPVVSLVRSRRAPPVPLIVFPKSCSCRWGPCPRPIPRLACLFSFFLSAALVLGRKQIHEPAIWWGQRAGPRLTRRRSGQIPALGGPRKSPRGKLRARQLVLLQHVRRLPGDLADDPLRASSREPAERLENSLCHPLSHTQHCSPGTGLACIGTDTDTTGAA